MQHIPQIPPDGMKLADAFNSFWKARNASFLFAPYNFTNKDVADIFWSEYSRRWDDTLSEFIRLALKPGKLAVYFIGETGDRFTIPPSAFARHRPFGGISSIATPGPNGEIDEAPGDGEDLRDALAPYNGVCPFVISAEFRKWMVPFEGPALESSEDPEPKGRGRPRGSSPFDDESLFPQMYRAQLDEKCSDHSVALKFWSKAAGEGDYESKARRLRMKFKTWKKKMGLE